MAITLGQTATWGLRVYDAAGALADLGGGDPTVTVTLPDGTTTAATVTNEATGTYYAALVTPQVGRLRATWTGTGANSGGLPKVDLLDVHPTDPRMIVGLAEVRATINEVAGSTTDDDELREFIVAATEVVEHIAGPVLGATKTHTCTAGGRFAVLLPDRPTTVTSVVEDGTTLTDGTGFVWDEAGVVWRGSQPHAGTWTTTPRGVVVTYTVGPSVAAVSGAVRKAAALLVRHWWLQTQQSPRSLFGSDYETPDVTVLAGYAVPNFVTDLLSAHRAANKVPGFA